MDHKLDFVAIGDIVTDAFIELEDAWIETDNPEKNKELCMRFGDKIPYRSVDIVRAVGNGPNAAVSAHRLGLRSAIITDLGDDDHGAACMHTLEDEGITTEFVRVHSGEISNYHYVLRYQSERTILVKHQEYDYQFPAEHLESQNPAWLYLTSLGTSSEKYHHQIADYLEAHPQTRLAFQPGTFQMKMGTDTLSRLYALTGLFFCNVEEAQRILNIQSTDIHELCSKLHALGPQIVAITDGPHGAHASDGKTIWSIPMYPDTKEPVDRTGAGDAFASTFTSAIALGYDIPSALMWGPVNSMSVVQYIGAQEGLLHRSDLEAYLTNAPKDWVATALE